METSLNKAYHQPRSYLYTFYLKALLSCCTSCKLNCNLAAESSPTCSGNASVGQSLSLEETAVWVICLETQLMASLLSQAHLSKEQPGTILRIGVLQNPCLGGIPCKVTGGVIKEALKDGCIRSVNASLVPCACSSRHTIASATDTKHEPRTA